MTDTVSSLFSICIEIPAQYRMSADFYGGKELRALSKTAHDPFQ